MSVIIIGGIKHCGKSSLGLKLAKHYEIPFFDVDKMILEETGNIWNSVREIWKRMGKTEFLRIEESAMRNFSEWVIPSCAGSRLVLSLGGGTIENGSAMGWLGKVKGLKIYIYADADMLFERIMSRGKPPFLSEDNPHEDFMALYKKRDVAYREYADIIHEVDDSPLEVNTQRLLVRLEEYYAR